MLLRFLTTFAAAGEVRYLTPKDLSIPCVLVSENDLVQTPQISATGGGDLATQTEEVATAMRRLLSQLGSGWGEIVKVNVYTASDEDAVSVAAILNGEFEGNRTPALMCVTTPLKAAGSRVAMDVIATVPSAAVRPNTGSAGFLQSGPRVFLSGQAQKGDGTMADATRKTLLSLERTLNFLGLQQSNVVQVKCFLSAIGAVSEAEIEIAAWFGAAKNQGGRVLGELAPGCPTAFVEWQSPLPIEIEMVVAAPHFGPGPSVEVRTPPGMTAAAVYSRLTIVRHPTLIYIGGLYPASHSAAPDVQLRSLFSRLKQCLDATGSDWMHLAKATYYVSDESLSREHNMVRPDYFSPRRPPAASKANVHGVGLPGHGIAMDFIVVPGEP